MYVLSDLYYQWGDIAKAKLTAETCIAKNKNFSNAYNLLGLISQRNGDFDHAKTQFEKAIEENSRNVLAENNLAYVYFKQGNPDNATTLFKRVLDEKPGDSGASLGLAEIGLAHDFENQKKNVKTYLDTALKTASTDDRVNYVMGKYYVAIGNYDDAIDYVKKAIAFNSRLPAYYVTLTELYLHHEQYSDAIQSIGFALRMESDNSHAVRLLALTYMKMNRYDKAAVVFEKELSLNPEDPEFVYYSIGKCYEQMGERKNSFFNYRKAIDLLSARKTLTSDETTQLCDSYLFMGRHYDDLGKPNQSINYYNKVIALCPDRTEVNKYMGFAYRDLGNKEKAIAYFKVYLSSDIKPEDSADIIEVVKRLR